MSKKNIFMMSILMGALYYSAFIASVPGPHRQIASQAEEYEASYKMKTLALSGGF